MENTTTNDAGNSGEACTVNKNNSAIKAANVAAWNILAEDFCKKNICSQGYCTSPCDDNRRKAVSEAIASLNGDPDACIWNTDFSEAVKQAADILNAATTL